MRRNVTGRLLTLIAVFATVVATGGAWTGPAASIASAGAAACAPGAGASSAARVSQGASANEPELYPKNEANAYGVIKDAPRLPNGGVTTNSDWYTVVPGKNERDMKQALYTGDARTLNVYAANIGGGLLGRAIPSPMRWATG
jgi:hypothetical protein